MDKLNKMKELRRILRKNSRILSFSYRGDRTFVVVPGLNHPGSVNISDVTGLRFYEERMLFFSFLLKYSRTRIIYVASKGFNSDLFRYYVGLLSNSDEEIEDKLKRLTYIEIDDSENIPLVKKLLRKQSFINAIKKEITEPRKTVLRCYNPTDDERNLAVKLGIPLFGSDQKFDFIGTKSGGRKVFKSAGANLIPGFNDLKNFGELCLASAKLIKKYPDLKRLMIKRDYSSSGKGNCILLCEDFIKEKNIDIKKIELDKLARLIDHNFSKYASFQNPNATYEEYRKRFNVSGGIVELYVEGEVKFSPSTQVLITHNQKAKIVSTHEQILGGPDKQLYLGCLFPSLKSHRKLIIKEGEKIAQVLAKKGIVGNFAIDYVVTYDKDLQNPTVYPIEINLRKGGTTHPFRIAYYLTSAQYNPHSGTLQCGKTPICYKALDFIESQKYIGIKPPEIISLVEHSKISFNKNTKKGVLVYMPGMITEYGRFGAICIGQSTEEADNYYKKLIKLVNSYASKRSKE